MTSGCCPCAAFLNPLTESWNSMSWTIRGCQRPNSPGSSQAPQAKVLYPVKLTPRSQSTFTFCASAQPITTSRRQILEIKRPAFTALPPSELWGSFLNNSSRAWEPSHNYSSHDFKSLRAIHTSNRTWRTGIQQLTDHWRETRKSSFHTPAHNFLTPFSC